MHKTHYNKLCDELKEAVGDAATLNNDKPPLATLRQQTPWHLKLPQIAYVHHEQEKQCRFYFYNNSSKCGSILITGLTAALVDEMRM